MYASTTVSLTARLKLSRLGDGLVGVLQGSAEMHFFDGSAEDVVADLQHGPKTFTELLALQQQRYPEVEGEPLMQHLLVFLEEAKVKELVDFTVGA